MATRIQESDVLVISADSEHNDDDDYDDEIPREERIPRSRISWLVLIFLDGDNGRDVRSLDPSPP